MKLSILEYRIILHALFLAAEVECNRAINYNTSIEDPDYKRARKAEKEYRKLQRKIGKMLK